MTILIIDDAKLIRKILTEILVQKGHIVIEATDGKGGLWRLAQNPTIELIITDLRMDNMNGYDFAEKAKKMSKAPILLHTSAPDAVKISNIDEVIAKGSFDKIDKYLNGWPIGRDCNL